MLPQEERNLAFVALVLCLTYTKKDLASSKWLLIAAIVFVPLAYIASESGWLVAEFGRQPWTIQDMLPTWAAVSDINSSSVGCKQLAEQMKLPLLAQIPLVASVCESGDQGKPISLDSNSVTGQSFLSLAQSVVTVVNRRNKNMAPTKIVGINQS